MDLNALCDVYFVGCLADKLLPLTFGRWFFTLRLVCLKLNVKKFGLI